VAPTTRPIPPDDQLAAAGRRVPIAWIVAAAVVVVLLLAVLFILRGRSATPSGAPTAAGAPTSGGAVATAPVGEEPTIGAATQAPVGGGGEAPAAPEPAGKLIFQDDFNNKAAQSGLEDALRATDFSRGFHPPGVYHVIPTQPNTSNWVVLPRQALGDFSMQVELWDDSDELQGDFAEGLIFRARDLTHFYALLIDPRNGKYSVRKYDGLDKVSDLIPWSESPLINQQKEHNLVRVDGQGGTFTLYLNGKQLASFTDDAYGFGMLGMIAANTDAVKPHPHFDNLVIWSADAAPTPADLPAERADPAGDMVLIQGGEFILGGNERSDAQTHIVGLTAFYIDRSEVTNAAYKQCIAAGKCAPPRQVDSATHPGYFNDAAYDNYPVIYVTWEQARQFCGWAGKRLPNEAEWEKAASWNAQERAKVLYPWGSAFDPAKLNSADSSSVDVVQVGGYGNEINGTVDMGGNVSEWTNSLARAYPYSEADGREEYPAPGERVFRGGSWAQTEGKARVDNRRSAPPDYPDREIGFRCALTP
jgi:formylglycine-generating enzyme required for sulfatase activity